MVTLDGRVTDNEKERYGRETSFLLTHPEYVFFVDEVGCNTLQKLDGNIGGGGTKICCPEQQTCFNLCLS
jgi:hypothetical protein